MSRYQQVLGLISQGTPIPQIVERLNIREDAVLAMVESMVRSGHLQDLDCAGGACSACPMSEGCPVPQDGPSQYFVTEDGLALLTETENTDGTNAELSPSADLSSS